jgi:hypothetical protein
MPRQTLRRMPSGNFRQNIVLSSPLFQDSGAASSYQLMGQTVGVLAPLRKHRRNVCGNVGLTVKENP